MTKDKPMATGVVIAYKRLDNMQQIVDSFLSADFINEVIIWSNLPQDETLHFKEKIKNEWESKKVAVCGLGENIFLAGRFLAAGQATNSLIATCDDDCLVSDWNQLYERHLATGKIACYMNPKHEDFGIKKWRHGYGSNGRIAYETLLGWGAVFSVEQIGKAFSKWRGHFGDEHHELFDRKADRIFAILQDEKHEQIRKEPNHLKGANFRSALCRKDDHYKLTREAQLRCLEILNKEDKERE